MLKAMFFFLVFCLACLGNLAKAQSTCPGALYSGTPDLAPANSTPNNQLQSFVNDRAQWSDGVKIKVVDRGSELWLDVTEFPGSTLAVAGLRIVWLVARISSGSQKAIVFVDGDSPIFMIDSVTLKDQGCRFVIGGQGGENPIALIREFFDALRYYDNAARVSPFYNGSLLGDTSTAMGVHNDVFLPKWILSAVR